MDVKDVKIEESWKNVLQAEFDTQYFRDLRDFVRGEHIAEKPVYPKATEIFQAFNACPFDKVKVVILGQDPYHGTATDTQGLTVEQANGLSFAVHTGIPLPPSLKNIFKEIESDIGITPLQDGDLNRWAKQGVLLLNATLTVAAHQPGSHQKRGWEEFTDAAIRALSDRREHIVFLLWGNYAKQKGAHIDRTKHLVLETTHPSPFSVHNGFFGSKHFSKTNIYLREHGLSAIDWK
jgi:uracil-DNA glycosylase